MNRQFVYAMAFMAVSAVAIYFHFKPEPAPTGIHLEARPAPELSKVPHASVSIAKPVRVYAPAAKRKLNLPEAIKSDPDKHVIASSKTANDERQHTITTVIDAATGEATTLDRVDPLPWIAPNTKTELGMYYGYRNGTPALRVQGSQELLQVKALHLGAIANADVMPGQVDTFVGVGVWARW